MNCHYHFVLIIIALLCSGCSKHLQIETDLQRYADRLQDFTEIRVTPPIADYALRAPKKIEVRHNLPSLNINLREFYAFNECSLNQLVAQRNTALGKMQLPSTRFVYETQLIAELKNCILLNNDSEDKTNLNTKLTEWLAIKEQQLAFVWTNLITQSDEIHAHISMANGFISGQASDDLQVTKQALSFLLNSEHHRPVNLGDLEHHLQQLRNSPLLARMWRTQRLFTQYLDSLSPLLAQYVTKNTCSTLQQKQDIKIMQNIFKMFFADKIQAIGGELNRYHYILSPIILNLSHAVTDADAFSAFIQNQAQTQHDLYKQSMAAHIKLWQQVFALCD